MRAEDDAEPGHVLVLNQYVVPDAAVTGRFAFEIAAAIAAAGHRVTFVAGQPSYLADQPPAPSREVREGVDIRRLRIFGRGGRRSRARRFLGYVAYLARAALVATRLARHENVRTVICFHNPPFLPLVGAVLAGRDRRRRFICVIQDIHPDVVIATRWMSVPAPLVAAWERVNRWIYDRAGRVVVISDDMRAVLTGKGVDPAKVVSIPLWAEPELEPIHDTSARRPLGIGADELLVLCAGNLGVTQRLEPVLAAAESLTDAPVRFCFAGVGVHSDRWREAARGLPNVTFLPFQGPEEYRRLVAACDVGLVTLAPEVERLVVPSRAMPLLSAGVPLIAVMSPMSELGRLIVGYGCGACVQRADELASVVRAWTADRTRPRVAGARAREAYEATRNRAVLTERYVRLCRD